MCEQLSRLSGPDFLDAVADVELNGGRPVNADVFKQRALEWRQLQADNDRAAQRIVEQQQALDRARAALQTAQAVPA